ncbi:ATP-binding cassette domain-containing protein [Candidatus Peregrinibacteria bacterium]|nr:MAG: ATP-binding cassette domain-containing protein [Candidatus Peregrinibacteria bacterium]
MFFTLFRTLWLSKNKRAMFLLVLGNLVFVLLSLVEPIFFREIIDTLLQFESENSSKILLPLFLILGVWAGVAVCILLVRALVAYFADKMAHILSSVDRAHFFTHVLGLSPSFFSEMHSGKLMKNFTKGTDNMFWARLDFYRNILPEVFTVFLLFPFLFILNWRFALLCCTLLFPFFCLGVWMLIRVGGRQEAIEKIYSQETEFVSDTFGNAFLVKSFGLFGNRKHQMKGKQEEILQKQLPLLRWWASLVVLSRIARTVIFFAIFAFGAFLFFRELATIGEIVMFSGFSAMALASIESVTWAIDSMIRRVFAIQEFYRIVDTLPEIIDAPEAIPLTPVLGKVEFCNVSFSYFEETSALKNLSFSVNPGQVIALTGHTGAGKTTVSKLLLRFYDPQKGEIFIDGRNIRAVTQKSLHENIGVVFQETALFNASIRENIAVGRLNASEKEIVEAAKKAQAWEFISKLPKKFDTIVGERGVRLSGGEKQRVALARVFLKNPPILVLDEATSALDAITEQKLQEALEELMKNRTTFVIAHRLSTIRKADCIFVFENGQLVEEGSYYTLLRKKGIFAELVAAQTNGFVE